MQKERVNCSYYGACSKPLTDGVCTYAVCEYFTIPKVPEPTLGDLIIALSKTIDSVDKTLANTNTKLNEVSKSIDNIDKSVKQLIGVIRTLR